MGFIMASVSCSFKAKPNAKALVVTIFICFVSRHSSKVRERMRNKKGKKQISVLLGYKVSNAVALSTPINFVQAEMRKSALDALRCQSMRFCFKKFVVASTQASGYSAIEAPKRSGKPF